LRVDTASGGDGFFIRVEEVNTVRADPQMTLEVALDRRAQAVVKIIEQQIGHLFAGYLVRCFMRFVACHVD